MSKIFVGLGNPILTDDAVGILVLNELKRIAGNKEGLTFSEINSGGLALMDLVSGYDQSVLIDSIITNQVPVGTLIVMSPEDFTETRHVSNLHDINFATAMKMTDSWGLSLPKDFRIYAIEVEEVLKFGLDLTKRVQRNFDKIVTEIAKRENLI